MKRLLTIALIAALSLSVSRPAFADQESVSIRKQIAELTKAALLEAEQARPNAPNQSDDNKYFWPAVLLMSGGGVVTLYGMTRDTGFACSNIMTSPSCGVTKSKATIFTGIGLVGAGAFLFYKGKHSPSVVFGPRVIGVRQQLTW